MGETGEFELIKQFGIWILVGVVGMGTLIYGLWGVMGGEKATVEIVRGGSELGEKSDLLYVDIAGAVEKPGVYKLPSGSRIGDALVLAGGLAASADREWVAKTINLASEVKDGGKIFIPSRNENNHQAPNSKLQTNSNDQNSKMININTAGMGELDTLVGIGEARAQAIIDNRPYESIEELVSKAKIPQSVYDKIKDSISIY